MFTVINSKGIFMKTKVLLLIYISLFAGYITAQSSVQIKDIYVQPIIGIDSVDSNLSNLTFEVMFKMNDPGSAALIYIQFGTAKNSADVFSVQAEIVQQNGLYYVSYNGQQEVISGYDTRIFTELSPEQESDYSFITLFVEDSEGELSNKLYFTK
jgi:hypothetical protein